MAQNREAQAARVELTRLIYDVRFKPMTNEQRALMHNRIRELSAMLGIEEEKKK